MDAMEPFLFHCVHPRPHKTLQPQSDVPRYRPSPGRMSSVSLEGWKAFLRRLDGCGQLKSCDGLGIQAVFLPYGGANKSILIKLSLGKSSLSKSSQTMTDQSPSESEWDRAGSPASKTK